MQSTPKKKFPLKKALLLLISLIVFFSIYQIASYFYVEWIIHVYCIAAGVLAFTYVVMNRGMLSKPERDRLPDDWSEAKKNIFLAEQEKRRKKSSVLLYFLIPIIMTVLFDMIYIYLTINMGIKLG